MNKRPNIIYILADDMGYGDFSMFNPEGPHTPALDSLTRDGVTLTNCYSASPVCAPARAAILTGRYPQRCGVIDTLEARGLDRLKTSETTLADILLQNGYRTALIGKWHLGAIDPEYHPNRRGFEEFFGFRGGWNDYFNYHIERNGTPVACEGKYITDVFSDAAAEYVRAHADEPFFLHLAYNAPHFPLQAPEETVEKYAALGKFNKAVCKLYAMIEIMDRGVGRVLNALDEAGIAQNTIVIFASDNGPDMGGTGEACQKRFNCDLRAEKMYVYEGGIKVPAVIRYPLRFAANTRCDAIVHGTDWLPTILSLCGVALPEGLKIDGLDMTEVICREKAPQERTLYWQWCRYEPEIRCNAAMRKGDRKLVNAPKWEYLDLPDWEVDMDVDIKYHPEHFLAIMDRPAPQRTPVEAPEAQLFDLKADPHERTDIAGRFPAEAQAMEKSLNAWFEEVESDHLR